MQPQHIEYTQPVQYTQPGVIPQPSQYAQPATQFGAQPSAPTMQNPIASPMSSDSGGRGWVIAGGVHIVFMISAFIYSLVYASFEPFDYGDLDFSGQLLYAMQTGTVYFALPSFVVSMMSVYMALNAKCSKALACTLPAISHAITLILWALIMSSVSEIPFSDAWDEIFGEDFFENILPELLSHLALCTFSMMLISIGNDE